MNKCRKVLNKRRSVMNKCRSIMNKCRSVMNKRRKVLNKCRNFAENGNALLEDISIITFSASTLELRQHLQIPRRNLPRRIC